MVPNTAHILQFTLSELRSRTYTMYLELRIFSFQYSTERICDPIRDISTLQCALYCKLGAIYSAHPPDYIMWTVVPAIYNEMTTPDIQSSIFNRTYLRCYWRYPDISMCVILPTWCQIQRISSCLRWIVDPTIYSLITAPHIQDSIFNWTYLRCNWRYVDNSASVILQPWWQYSAQPPVCAMWIVVPAMYNVITVPRI
jgi:hypothetical protein